MVIRRPLSVRSIVLIGLLAATIEVGKLVLSFLPNIEIVTLLCGLYGYVFGPVGVAATVVFVCIEPMIWGFHLWVISYFLYWPLVAIVFWLLGRVRIRNRVILTAAALALTVWFGILDALVQVGLFSGAYHQFFERFCIYYLRGVGFYVAQLATNAVVFPLLFRPVAQRLERMDRMRP